ncbi:MAG: hypothetical protein SOZ67_06570 [Alloprevotella sp.]|nr:hypothetical protein [Alloprevotella sp.]
MIHRTPSSMREPNRATQALKKNPKTRVSDFFRNFAGRENGLPKTKTDLFKVRKILTTSHRFT